MTNIAALEVELDLDDRNFTVKMQNAGAQTTKFGKTVDGQTASLVKMEREIDSVSKSLSRMQNIAKGFIGFEFLKEGLSSLIRTQKDLQQIQYGLRGALGSAVEASSAFDYIIKKSHELGLDLKATATEFTKVTAAATAMNIPMKEQRDLFDALARSQTVMHLSTEQVKYSTMALAQVFSKGKFQAEELRRQLGEQIPGVVPRFQNAVMRMTAGTDLAGKSFDQLLQEGKLTADRFLPAMIEALRETGRGAEDAAEGLNATLNRLSTSWFELRTQMTSGLFNDAVIGSVSLLANNLQRLAATAAMVVAVAGARTLSGGVQKGADRAKRLQQEVVGERMAAAAEKQHWEQTLAKNKADQASVEVTMRKNAETLRAARVERQEAQVLRDVAAEANKLAQAELRVTTARTGRNTPKAFYRRAESARAVEAAAQETLNAAELKEIAIQREVQKTLDAQIAARARSAELKRAETVATEQLAVANRQLTATDIGARIKTSIKSIGTSLLSLVGGPIGAAVLALGAVVMKFASSREEARELEKKINDDVKSMKLLALESSQLHEKFKEIGNANPFSEIAEEASKFKDKLQSNQQELAKLDEWLANHSKDSKSALTSQSAIIVAVYGAWDKLTGKYEATSKRAKQLREENVWLSDQIDADTQQNVKNYAQAWDGVGKSIEGMKLSMSGTLDLIGRLSTEIPEAQRKMADMDGARAAWARYSEDIFNTAEKLEKSARQKGMTKVEQLQDELDTALKKAKQGNVLDPENSDAVKAAQRALAAQRQIDGYTEAKKAAAKAEREQKQAEREHDNELASLLKRIKDRHDQDLAQLDAQQKLTPAERLRVTILEAINSSTSRLTASEKKLVMSKVEAMTIDGKRLKQQQQELKNQKELTRLQDRIAASKATVIAADSASLGSYTNTDSERQAMERQVEIKRDYENKLRELNRNNTDHDDPGYQSQRDEIEHFYEWRLSQEQAFQREKKNLERDGLLGFRMGVKQFTEDATKMGEKMRDVGENAMNGLTDKLTELVTTGKASFKDLFTSLLKEITRVLMAKAVAQLASLIGGMFGTTYSANGNVMTAGGPVSLDKTATYSANGNVMTAAGPAKLNYYENGGIARSPQLSVFGEGRLPEAYVPLPDGRSIPVTMKSGGSGGTQNNIDIQVNVQADGKSSVDAKSSESLGNQLGEMLGSKVRSVMVDEMRQGGLLWRMTHNRN